ncbi:MAG TPA: hypothetical protein VF765_10385 [Polyangiaceae bacterium]
MRSRFVLAVVTLGVAACSSASGTAGGVSTAPCTLPAGPYGTNLGDVVDPSLAWQGYVDDSGQTTTVHLADYYDCNGSRGVRALVVDESAQWCADCQSQAPSLAMLAPGKWKNEGVALLVLMAQDQQENPATVDTALTWRNEFALTTGAVVADPAWTTKLWNGATSAGNGFPTDIVIDPRTLRIVAFQPGNLAGTVDNLAIANR